MAEKSMDFEFAAGDYVVHPAQGAGTLTNIATMEVAGTERHYYCIELVNGEGQLMLPIQQAEEIGLRKALRSLEEVREVMFEEPEELPSNYRSREAHVSKMIGSGELSLLIQAIRDLAWHGHQNRLTNTDARLKSEAQKLVASELAVALGISYESAQRRLNELVTKGIKKHDEALN
jgi:CarD family transcriptional regulator